MQCNVCENTVPAFVGAEKECPICHCRPQHRALLKKFGKDIITPGIRVLDVGPHVALARHIEKAFEALTDSAYLPIDPRPMRSTILPIDITQQGLAIHECDIVICQDVLDEIRDENVAMQNILGNMAPGAKLIFSVPLKAGTTDRGHDVPADNSHAKAKTKEGKHVKVLKAEDRITRFGGQYKFRKYGEDDIIDFINGYGFNAKFVKIKADADLGIENDVDLITATKE